jgi:tryptophanyl-tRNA synthetase
MSEPPEAPAIKPADPAGAHEQVVTPWDVQGSVSNDGKQLAIDYDKLIDQFGTRRVDQALLDRFERVTGHKPHILLRRGTFFSHRRVFVVHLDAFMRWAGVSNKIPVCREFDKILDRFEQGKPFFLYTGRGPSSDSMHLGHMSSQIHQLSLATHVKLRSL